MLISNMLYVTLLNIIVNKPLEINDFESLTPFKLSLINQDKLPSCHLSYLSLWLPATKENLILFPYLKVVYKLP